MSSTVDILGLDVSGRDFKGIEDSVTGRVNGNVSLEGATKAGGTYRVKYLTGNASKADLVYQIGQGRIAPSVGDTVEVCAYSSAALKSQASWECSSVSSSLPSGAAAGAVTGNALGALYVETSSGSGVYYKFVCLSRNAEAWGVTTDGTDSLANLQAAVRYLHGIFGGELQIPYGCKTSGTLSIGSRVILQGGRLTCTASNVPIIRADLDTLNSFWQVRDTILEFETSQTGTEAIGIEISTTNKVAFEYVIRNVRVRNAKNGIRLPELTGCFAFLGTHENIQCDVCTGPAVNILGSTTGALTNLSFIDVYARGVNGSEIDGAALCVIKRVQNLYIKNMAGDHLSARQFAFFETCSGVIENMAIESCVRTASSGTSTFFEFSGCNLDVGVLTTIDNVVTISGTAASFHTRATSGSSINLTIIEDKNTAVTDTSSDAYYTVGIDSTSRLWNDIFSRTGASPTLSTNEFSTNVDRRIRRLNGNDRAREEGGRLLMFGTAAPTSGTYAVGDRMRNTSPSTTSPVVEWICTAAGSPGTWHASSWLVLKGATAGRPSSLGSLDRVTYLDTTLAANGKPILWTGTTWVDFTGTAA